MIHPWCRELCARLEQAEARYVAVSGTAVVLHGYVRPSLDLDIVISPAPPEANRVMHVLMRAGFAPSLPLPINAVTVMRMFDREQREVDVFARYLIPFEDLWAGSQMAQAGDSTVRIMSLDHLLSVKRTVGREHDLLDVAGLLALKRATDGQDG